MDMKERRRLGGSEVEVTTHGFGGVPLGNLYRKCSDEDARATLGAAWAAGIRFYDTAPLYGHGMSEHRIGHFMHQHPRDEWVLSTKIGRVLKAKDPSLGIDTRNFVDYHPFEGVFDYTYDGVMRSFEDSLQRLATYRVDVLLVHDIDIWTHGSEEGRKAKFRELMDSGYKALRELRDSGTVKAIGAGVNEVQAMLEFGRAGVFDCFLLAGRYTLLEQDSLDPFLALCAERGAGVIVGGGFNSGILATGAVPGAKYNYSPAPEDIVAKVKKIEAVCAEFDVALPAAALQFVTAHPAVPTFCAGTRNVEQLEQNVAWFEAPIPGAFWQALKDRGLLREDAPVPAG
ncbi:MAG: aldo/keto reductase [Geminicoccaceae bacterium]